MGGTGSLRGQHGDKNYRAPECFKEDAKPSRKADLWSLGAIAYELSTGEEIYAGCNPEEISPEELQRRIDKKIKSVRREIRPFLRKTLRVKASERYPWPSTALEDLEDLIKTVDANEVMKKHFGWSIPVAIAIGLASFCTYLYSTHEPQKLGIPEVHVAGEPYKGLLYKPTTQLLEQISFDAEKVFDLPETRPMGMMAGGRTKLSKQSTDNRIVAYLVKTYAQATELPTGEGFFSPKAQLITEYQKKIYERYLSGKERGEKENLLGPVFPVWAKSIEVALSQAPVKDGRVDLEDLMVATRLGWDVVEEAKKVSQLPGYNFYRNATNQDGSFVISPPERKFIDNWIAYFQADRDD
jgi:hypothetical protein